MLGVPAFIWRGGAIARGVVLGVGVGSFLGALAWLDSGMWLPGVIVFVILSLLFGFRLGRRMVRYWPGAKHLAGDDRVQVVRATRRGTSTPEARLAPAVVDYANGLAAAAENFKWLRWLVVFLLVVALGTAAWDAVAGSLREVVASSIYVVLLLAEEFWWPKHRTQLLANANRAREQAASVDC